jgi:hypothetical protein
VRLRAVRLRPGLRLRDVTRTRPAMTNDGARLAGRPPAERHGG